MRTTRVWPCVLAVGVLLLGLSPAVRAGGESGSEQAPAGEQDDPVRAQQVGAVALDADVLLAILHLASDAQIQLGQLAEDKAQRRDVRAYARRLMGDHALAERRVERLASELGLDLATALPEGPLPIVQTLREVSADLAQIPVERFDERYLQVMVQTHQELHAVVGAALGRLEDEQVRQLAEALRPILKQHVALGRALRGDAPVAALNL